MMRCVLRTHSAARARASVQLRDMAVKTFSSVKLIEAVNPEIYLDAAPDAIDIHINPPGLGLSAFYKL